MPHKRVLGPACLGLAMAFLATGRVGGQQPAPVENVSTFEHRSPADERKALHAPPGFEVQLVAAEPDIQKPLNLGLVAAEPDIQKPLNLAFDDKGRLWITDTVEYPYAAPEGAKTRDTVKILS